MHLMALIKAIIISREYTKRENMVLWGIVAVIFYYSVLSFSVWQTFQSKIILFMMFALIVNFTGRDNKRIENRNF